MHVLHAMCFTLCAHNEMNKLAQSRLLQPEIGMSSVHQAPIEERENGQHVKAFKVTQFMNSPVGFEVGDKIVLIVLVDAEQRSDLAVLLARSRAKLN